MGEEKWWDQKGFTSTGCHDETDNRGVVVNGHSIFPNMSDRNSEVARNMSWSHRLAVMAFGGELFLRFLFSLLNPFDSLSIPRCFPLNELMGLDVRLGIVTITSIQWNNLSLRFRLLNDWRISVEIQGMRLQTILTEKSSDNIQTAAAALSTENLVIPTTATAASGYKIFLTRLFRWGMMMFMNLVPFVTISLNNCIISMSVVDETVECRFESCQLHTSRQVGGATQPRGLSSFSIGNMDLKLAIEKLAVDVVHSTAERSGMDATSMEEEEELVEGWGSVSSSILTLSTLLVTYAPDEQSQQGDIQLRRERSTGHHEVNSLDSRSNRRGIGIDVVCGDVALTVDETLHLSTVTVARALHQRLTSSHSSLLATFRRRFDSLLELLEEFINQPPSTAGIAIDVGHRSVDVLDDDGDDTAGGGLSLWGKEKDKKNLRINVTARSVQLLSVVSAAEAARLVSDSDDTRDGLIPPADIPSSPTTNSTTVLSMRDLTIAANDIFSDDVVTTDTSSRYGGTRHQDLRVLVGGLSGSDVTLFDLMSDVNGSSTDGGAMMDWQYSTIYEALENNHSNRQYNLNAAATAAPASGSSGSRFSLRKRLSLTADVKPFQLTFEATALAPVLILAMDLAAIVKAAVATASMQRSVGNAISQSPSSSARNSRGAVVSVIDNVFEDFRISCGDFQIVVNLPSTNAQTTSPYTSKTSSTRNTNSATGFNRADAADSHMKELALVLRVEGVEGYCDESRSRVSSSSSAGERGKCLVLAIASIAVDHVARSTSSRCSPGSDSASGRVAVQEETMTMVQVSDFLAAAALSTATAPAGGWKPLPPPPPPAPPSSSSSSADDDQAVSEEADVHAWKTWLQDRTTSTSSSSSSSSSHSSTATTSGATVGDDSDDVTSSATSPRSFLDIDCAVQLLALALDPTTATSMGMLASILIASPASQVPRAAASAPSPIVPISRSMLEGPGCRVSVHVASFEGKLLVPDEKAVAAAVAADDDGEMFVLRCRQKPPTVLLRPPLGGFRVKMLTVAGVAQSCDILMDGGLSLAHLTKASSNDGAGDDVTSTTMFEFGLDMDNSPTPASPSPSLHVYSHVRYPVNTFLVSAIPSHGSNLPHSTNSSSSSSSSGICVMRSVRSIGADRLMVCLDAIDIEKFVQPLAAFAIGRRRSNNDNSNNNGNSDNNTSVSSSATTSSRTGPRPTHHRIDNDTVAVWKVPTSICSLHIQTMSVRLTHDRKAVMALGAKEIEVYNVNFADRLVSPPTIPYRTIPYHTIIDQISYSLS